MSKPGTISAAVAPWKADRDGWKARASRAEADLAEAVKIVQETVTIADEGHRWVNDHDVETSYRAEVGIALSHRRDANLETARAFLASIESEKGT